MLILTLRLYTKSLISLDAMSKQLRAPRTLDDGCVNFQDETGERIRKKDVTNATSQVLCEYDLAQK